MSSPLGSSANGAGLKPAAATPAQSAVAVQKLHRVQVVPATLVVPPLAGHDIMESVQRSLGTFQSIVADIKDVLRGVEADVRAVETIQIVEERDKRSITLQRKYRILKDR